MRRILTWLAVAALLCACSRETPAALNRYTDGHAVDIPVEVTVPLGTRSSLTIADDDVRELMVLVFSDSLLVRQYLFKPPFDDAALSLLPGRRYRFHALANRGSSDENARWWDCLVDEDKHIATGLPQTPEGYVESICNIYGDFDGLNASGMPMAFSSPADWSFEVREASVKKVVIPLVRLAARYRFKLDRSALVKGDVEVTSISLKQSAWSVYPFRARSAADGSMVRDYRADDRATAMDCDIVNEGGFAEFYCLENMQGTLLPDNTDPWAKIPDNLPEDRAALCTYLEVTCRYRSHDGLASDNLVYRMYLGKDSCTNFDIERGTSADIMLSVSDMGMFRSSWKVDIGDVVQDRILEFTKIGEPFEAGADYSDTIEVHASPAGLDYSLAFDAGDAERYGLSVERIDSSRICVRTAYASMDTVTVKLTARTWDGLLSDVCSIRLDNTPFTAFDASLDGELMTGRWARINIPGNSPAHPVTAGTIRTDAGAQRDITSCASAELFFCPEDIRTLHLFPKCDAADSIVLMQTRRGQTARVVLPVESADPVVSVTGTVEVMDDGIRAARVSIGLKTLQGTPLPAGYFEVPAEVRAAFGYTEEKVIDRYFPYMEPGKNDAYDIERIYTTDSLTFASYDIYGLRACDTSAVFGWSGLAEASVPVKVSPVVFTPCGRKTITFEPLDVNRKSYPRNGHEVWFDCGYDRPHWELRRYRDIHGQGYTDPGTDLLMSRIMADSTGRQPLVHLGYPEMDEALKDSVTIDRYAAYPSGAYTLRGYLVNARNGRRIHKEDYDFDVVTVLPLGTYLTGSPRIGADPSALVGRTVVASGHIVPADYCWHRSYALWNGTPGPDMVTIDADGWNWMSVGDWETRWWADNVAVSAGTVSQLKDKSFEEICRFLYDRFKAKNLLDFSILPPYSAGPDLPRTVSDSYLLDRKEIEDNAGRMDYRGERGFYKFVKADSYFRDEDMMYREILNVRFNDWSDVWEDARYTWPFR